jgi:hypothetical protein
MGFYLCGVFLRDAGRQGKPQFYSRWSSRRRPIFALGPEFDHGFVTIPSSTGFFLSPPYMAQETVELEWTYPTG